MSVSGALAEAMEAWVPIVIAEDPHLLLLLERLTGQIVHILLSYLYYLGLFCVWERKHAEVFIRIGQEAAQLFRLRPLHILPQGDWLLVYLVFFRIFLFFVETLARLEE